VGRAVCGYCDSQAGSLFGAAASSLALASSRRALLASTVGCRLTARQNRVAHRRGAPGAAPRTALSRAVLPAAAGPIPHSSATPSSIHLVRQIVRFSPLASQPAPRSGTAPSHDVLLGGGGGGGGGEPRRQRPLSDACRRGACKRSDPRCRSQRLCRPGWAAAGVAWPVMTHSRPCSPGSTQGAARRCGARVSAP